MKRIPIQYVNENYGYAEGTSIKTHEIRLINDVSSFSQLSMWDFYDVQTGDAHPVEVQQRKDDEPYLVPNRLLP